MPKTAICFSGEIRSLKDTFESIKKNILSKFSDYDIFYFGWKDDPNIDDIKILLETGRVKTILLEERLTFVENHYFPENRPSWINYQAALRQFYCLQRVNDLKCNTEKSEEFIYDIVVRIRPDLLILNDTSLPYNFETNDFCKIYTLNHDKWHGTCDRFYASNSKNMDILSNRINFIKYFTNLGFLTHLYEAFFKFVIVYNEISEEIIETLETCLLRTDGTQSGEIISVKKGEIRMDGDRIFHILQNCYV